MFVVTIVNCALIISAFFVDDPNVLDIFETMDKVFFAIFSFECTIKIVSLGFYEYFGDSWYY